MNELTKCYVCVTVYENVITDVKEGDVILAPNNSTVEFLRHTTFTIAEENGETYGRGRITFEDHVHDVFTLVIQKSEPNNKIRIRAYRIHPRSNQKYLENFSTCFDPAEEGWEPLVSSNRHATLALTERQIRANMMNRSCIKIEGELSRTVMAQFQHCVAVRKLVIDFAIRPDQPAISLEQVEDVLAQMPWLEQVYIKFNGLTKIPRNIPAGAFVSICPFTYSDVYAPLQNVENLSQTRRLHLSGFRIEPETERLFTSLEKVVHTNDTSSFFDPNLVPTLKELTVIYPGELSLCHITQMSRALGRNQLTYVALGYAQHVQKVFIKYVLDPLLNRLNHSLRTFKCEMKVPNEIQTYLDEIVMTCPNIVEFRGYDERHYEPLFERRNAYASFVQSVENVRALVWPGSALDRALGLTRTCFRFEIKCFRKKRRMWKFLCSKEVATTFVSSASRTHDDVVVIK
jgi:hypothetical protein